MSEIAKGWVRLVQLSVIGLLAVSLAGHVVADTKNWQGTSGQEHDWFTDSNWSPSGEPGANDDAYINNGGTAKISTSETIAEAQTLYVGNTAAGGMKQIAGTLNVKDGAGNWTDMYLGYGTDGDGTYTLTDGLVKTSNTYVGYEGNATFHHGGGNHEIEYALFLGCKSGSRGEYELGVDFAVTSNLIGGFACVYIGDEGTGVFTHTDGNHNVWGVLVLGNQSTGDGAYAISGGTLNVEDSGTVDGVLKVGLDGTGTFKIVGDDATIDVDGYSQNSASTLELDINGISTINVDIEDGDGTVSLNGTLDVEFLVPATIGQDFTIIANDGSDPVTGIFSGKPNGSEFTVGGPGGSTVDLRIDYDGGDGNDVVLTVVPEPATLALLALGGLVLIRRRRA